MSEYQIFGSKHAYEVSEYLKGRGDFTESEINKILEQPKHVEQVAEFIKICDHYNRKKVVILCANIDHAEKICEEIEKYEQCMIIHSKIKKPHKRIEDYKKNHIRFCVSVMMLSEGTDIPQVDAIVYLRPTKSSRLMVQSAGRGLRLHEGKEFCLLLDYGHVFQNCGTPHRPIIPTNVGEKEENEPNFMRQCEACCYIFDIRDTEDKSCPACGHKNQTDRDAEKNLKKNIIEEVETHELILNSSHIYKRGTSKNGLPYLTVKIGLKTYHTFFGKQVKWLLSSLRPDAKVVYTMEGTSKFKVLTIEPHRLIL